MVVRFEGFATGEVADHILEALQGCVAQGGPLEVFDDWEHAIGYDPIVRTKLTGWMATHGGHVRATHVLVKSKVVAMGLTVANMLLANRHKIITYNDRRRWQAAMDAVEG